MPPTPSADPSDFDIWIGVWDLTWPHDGHGRNVISKVMDDRVVQRSTDDGATSETVWPVSYRRAVPG